MTDFWLSVGAVALLACSYFEAFQPTRAGEWAFYYWLSAPLVALATSALLFRMDRERLQRLLRPARGDVTLGAIVGFLLVFAVWLGRTQLLSSLGIGQNWLLFVYVQLGDSRKFEALFPVLGIALSAFAHEVLFHGYMQDALSLRFGKRGGYVATIVASGLVYAPSAVLLRPPHSPVNLLFVAIAILAALLCGGLIRVTNRLTPGIVARAVFLYFSIAQFRLPGL